MVPNQSKTRQCTLLLEALKEHGALTTIDIREGLGVMHVAGRVMDLRNTGHAITTKMGWHPDSAGKLRRQALYILEVAA